MPIIYLKHPDHGTKIATLDLEAEADEQNGWKRYNPDTPSFVEEVASEPDAAPVARRGRRRKTEELVETLVPNEGE